MRGRCVRVPVDQWRLAAVLYCTRLARYEERTAMHLAIGLDLIDRIPMLPSKRRLARKRKPSRINRPMPNSRWHNSGPVLHIRRMCLRRQRSCKRNRKASPLSARLASRTWTSVDSYSRVDHAGSVYSRIILCNCEIGSSTLRFLPIALGRLREHSRMNPTGEQKFQRLMLKWERMYCTRYRLFDTAIALQAPFTGYRAANKGLDYVVH